MNIIALFCDIDHFYFYLNVSLEKVLAVRIGANWTKKVGFYNLTL